VVISLPVHNLDRRSHGTKVGVSRNLNGGSVQKLVCWEGQLTIVGFFCVPITPRQVNGILPIIALGKMRRREDKEKNHHKTMELVENYPSTRNRRSNFIESPRKFRAIFIRIAEERIEERLEKEGGGEEGPSSVSGEHGFIAPTNNRLPSLVFKNNIFHTTECLFRRDLLNNHG
jgi:hypothetical protein